MEKIIMQKTQKLPTYEITKHFFDLCKNNSSDKMKSLVDKYVVLELVGENKNTFMVVPGKVLEYREDKLRIRLYDDGREETKEAWTTADGEDMFKEWEEFIEIEKIRGIEELPVNPRIEFIDQYINEVCEITNKNDDKIVGLITEYDGFELEFYTRIKDVEGEYLLINSYPFNLIKKITRLEMDFNE